MKTKVISILSNNAKNMFISWGVFVQRLNVSQNCYHSEEMLQWLEKTFPDEVAQLKAQDKYELLQAITFPKEDVQGSSNHPDFYSGHLAGQIRYALGAVLLVLLNKNMDQRIVQNAFDYLTKVDLFASPSRDINYLITAGMVYNGTDEVKRLTRSGSTFDDYTTFYEKPFADAFKAYVPKEEWSQWGVSPTNDNITTFKDNVPLLLMAISKYNPERAAELVETALCITSSCGRGSANRDMAAISIPFLAIPEERKQELIAKAFLMTDRKAFDEFMRTGDRSAVQGSSDYYSYLSFGTRMFVHSPRETLISWIKKAPVYKTLEATGIFQHVDLASLNLVGLYKLYAISLTKNLYNVKEVRIDANIDADSLNKNSWFGVTSYGPGTSVRISDI